MEERKDKELKLIENKIRVEIAAQTQDRKESEETVNQSLDEKVYSLRLELTKEKKTREEMEEDINNQISGNITKLNEIIDNEVINREDSYNHAI